MIELYRPVDCPDCEEFEAVLKEMVVAHKVITVEPGGWPEALPPQTPLPALKEGREIITDQAAIQDYLKELARFVQGWRRFQGDSCYIDSDGSTC
jgi:hypothetical protein